MKRIKYFIIAVMLMSIISPKVYAECTDEEINNIKKETGKIEITYEHLGETTNENGEKVYNEFYVTAKNIPNDIYVHVDPIPYRDFEITDDSLKIKLTTGEWKYNLYSAKCEKVIDSISFKLPKFNMYSLDPKCGGVDSSEFKLCGKYYEYNVDRSTFEKRLDYYLKTRRNSSNNNNNDRGDGFFSKVINYVEENLIYVLIVVGIVVLGIVAFIIIRKNNKRKIL